MKLLVYLNYRVNGAVMYGYRECCIILSNARIAIRLTGINQNGKESENECGCISKV
jgi:hypothetical protein